MFSYLLLYHAFCSHEYGDMGCIHIFGYNQDQNTVRNKPQNSCYHITRWACYKSEDYNAQQSRHIKTFSQIIRGMNLIPTYVILYNIPLSNLRFLNREVVYTKIVICSKLCYTSLHEICVL